MKRSALVGLLASSLFGIPAQAAMHPSAAHLRLTPTVTLLYAFKGGVDGSIPNQPLFGPNGTIYGTTHEGGTYGYGTVFELIPSGAGYIKTTLYSFTGGTDGALPQAPLAIDAAGNLYGTTTQGGATQNGVVFKLSASASGFTESTVYSFIGTPGTDSPGTGVIVDTTGAVYGTTARGGAYGQGTFYVLTPSGNTYNETTFYSFGGHATSADYITSIASDGHGGFLGTSEYGGLFGRGEVFALTVSASGVAERALDFFRSGATSRPGYNPLVPIVTDASGNIIGINAEGGATGFGAIYELHPTSAGGYGVGTIFDCSAKSFFGTGFVAGPGGMLYSPISGGFLVLTPTAKAYSTAIVKVKNLSPSGTLTADGSGNYYGASNNDIYRVTF